LGYLDKDTLIIVIVTKAESKIHRRSYGNNNERGCSTENDIDRLSEV